MHKYVLQCVTEFPGRNDPHAPTECFTEYKAIIGERSKPT